MITIKNLSFNYGKQKRLFDDFSLTLDDGRIVGLLGKNGAGKTTLLKIVAGLLNPYKGNIDVNGYNPFKRDPNFLTDIYMIPEEFSIPPISIAGYLKAMIPFYRSFDRKKLNDILEQFELKESDKLNRLSYGQQKKFLIAFALSSNCKLLIMDEPTNGLDIPSKSLFRKVVVSSVNDEQLVLISTHQVKDIDTIIDKIVVVDNGTTIYEDDIAEVSRKYLFETTQSIDGTKDIIYQERSPIGYRIIRPSDSNNETLIDMELLFNAIIHNAIKPTPSDEDK